MYILEYRRKEYISCIYISHIGYIQNHGNLSITVTSNKWKKKNSKTCLEEAKARMPTEAPGAKEGDKKKGVWGHLKNDFVRSIYVPLCTTNIIM